MHPIRVLYKNPPYLWLGFYSAINVIACLLILSDGKLLGETANIELYNSTPVILICFIVLSTYLLILGPLFRVFYKLRASLVPPVPATQDSGRDVGLVLLSLQIGFIFFVFTEGVFVAGSTERSTSIWSQFFVFFSCDTLFLLYYAYYRDNRLYVPNLIAAIASSLIRGWIGIFMTLIVLESIRLLRRRQLSITKIAVITSLILLLFPLLQILKITIRTAAMGTSLDYVNLLSSLSSNIEAEHLLNIFYGAFQVLIDRLQILSQYIVIYQNGDYLYSLYQGGQILPFWLDGIHGIAYHRFFGDTIPDNLGVHLAKLLDPLNTDVNWNSNPGLLAWFMINPLIGFAYGIYTISILYFTIVFIRGIRHKQPEVKDVVWLSWLVFLIPGWTGSLFLFFHTVFIFYFIHIFRRVFISH